MERPWLRGPWIAAVAALAIGLAGAANAAPHEPVTPAMPAGEAVNFMGFQDHGGTNYALQAPRDYSWLRLFGTKGNPVTRSASLSCPKRRSASGGLYVYTCTFIVADYAPGKYNVGRPRVMRQANGTAALMLAGDHSAIKIDLGTTTVYTATMPPRTSTEPARTATLTQVPL